MDKDSRIIGIIKTISSENSISEKEVEKIIDLMYEFIYKKVTSNDFASMTLDEFKNVIFIPTDSLGPSVLLLVDDKFTNDIVISVPRLISIYSFNPAVVDVYKVVFVEKLIVFSLDPFENAVTDPEGNVRSVPVEPYSLILIIFICCPCPSIRI